MSPFPRPAHSETTMRLINLFLGILLAMLAACTQQAVFPHLQEGQVIDEDRRILVTFRDQGIQRDLPTSSVDSYRVRGQYSNSSWSLRVADDLARSYGLRLIAQWPIPALGAACVVYEVPSQDTVAGVLERLGKDQRVSGAQRMQTYRVLAEKVSLTDPYLRYQNGLRAMNLNEAHRLASGKGVRVAVIDTGVDANHPDLAGQIAISEDLGPDAAGDGSSDRHGTGVAGVLVARANNGIGIVGVSPDAELIALRACWETKAGELAAQCNTFTLALALSEAIRLDAQIINMSLTGPDDPLVGQLIKAAVAKGIIVVAAKPALGEPGGFPANQPDVIGVASSSTLARHSGGELRAPGKDVLTTVPHGAYDYLSGSSLATPHISGLAALILELRPNVSASVVRGIIEKGESTDAIVDACAVLAPLASKPIACSSTMTAKNTPL